MEPAYFAAIKRACASTLIAVEVTPGVGVPNTLAQRAVQRARAEGLARRSRRSRFVREDRYEDARTDSGAPINSPYGLYSE